MKKRILLSILLIFALLAIMGCGPKDEENAGTPPQEGQAASEQNQEQASGSMDEGAIKNILSKSASAIKTGVTYDAFFSGDGQNSEATFWIQGENMKMSSEMEGMQSVTIIDSNYITTYDPVQKMGTKFKMSNEEEMMETGIDEDYDNSQLTYMGREKYDGQDCLVAMSKDQDGSSMKLWINEKLGMAVKTEGKTEDGLTITMEMKNIKVGARPASTFEVPGDVTIQTME